MVGCRYPATVLAPGDCWDTGRLKSCVHRAKCRYPDWQHYLGFFFGSVASMRPCPILESDLSASQFMLPASCFLKVPASRAQESSVGGPCFIRSVSSPHLYILKLVPGHHRATLAPEACHPISRESFGFFALWLGLAGRCLRTGAGEKALKKNRVSGC